MDTAMDMPCSPDRFRVGSFCKSCKLYFCGVRHNLNKCREMCPVVYEKIKRKSQMRTSTVSHNSFSDQNGITRTTYGQSLPANKLEMFQLLGYVLPILISIIVMVSLFILYKYNKRVHRYFDDIWGAIKRCGNIVTPAESVDQTNTFETNNQKYTLGTTTVHRSNNSIMSNINQVQHHHQPSILETDNLLIESDSSMPVNYSGDEIENNVSPYIQEIKTNPNNVHPTNSISHLTNYGNNNVAAVHNQSPGDQPQSANVLEGFVPSNPPRRSNITAENISNQNHYGQGYIDVPSQCNARSKLLLSRGSYVNLNIDPM